MKLLSAAALCASLASSAALAAPSLCDADLSNPVANCGFESGSFSGWTLSGATALAQPNLFGVDTLDADTGTYGAWFANQGATLGTHLASDNLVLSQSLTLEQGRVYTLTFDLAQDTPIFAGYTNYFAVTVDGAALLTEIAAPMTSGYIQEVLTFTGTGADMLSFAFENDAGTWSLDDVQIDQVPEPASVAMFAVGLLGVGLIARRRAA